MRFCRRFWYYAAQKVRPFFDVDMNGKKISGLPTASYPTEDDEAATKKYVDDVVPTGDMLKSTYDPGANGVVDNSEKLEASTKAQVRDHTPKAHVLSAHENPTSDISMNTKKITNLADPTEDQQAATKKYVDTLAGA